MNKDDIVLSIILLVTAISISRKRRRLDSDYIVINHILRMNYDFDEVNFFKKTDLLFRRYVHMDKSTFVNIFYFIIDVYEEKFVSLKNSPIIVYTAGVLYLTNIGSVQLLGDLLNISTSSVKRYSTIIVGILVDLYSRVIFFPVDPVELKTRRDLTFPGAYFAIDGTHVSKSNQIVNGRNYINRKGYQSINVLIVSDNNCNIRYILANKPGSVHDSRALKESTLMNTYINSHSSIRNRKMMFLGDSGYPLCKNLITPFRILGNSTDVNIKKNFNYYHSSARIVVERSIGRLKGRCLPLGLGLRESNPLSCAKIIIASTVLHQLCLDYEDCFSVEFSDNSSAENNPELVDINDDRLGIILRNNLANYFWENFPHH